MSTILAMVQADKEGEIESKMIKARQMEEIREARRVEAEKKEEEQGIFSVVFVQPANWLVTADANIADRIASI